MKKVIAFIFIVVFLFSVLPIREIGKLMGKGQTTEEVHNDDAPNGDNDFGGKIKKEIDPFIEMTFHTESGILESYNQKVLVAIHGSSVLPDHFVPRIPTPPPNFC